MSRNVLVTGGGTGIGRAIAARFARAGEQLTITGRRAALLAGTARDLGAHHVAFDASDPRAVDAALAELPAVVDVLVNAAGASIQPVVQPGSLPEVSELWIANLRANLPRLST